MAIAMVELETAWLAGFIDGEGSYFVARTTISGRGGKSRYESFRPRLEVCNTHLPSVDRAEALLKEFGRTTRKASRLNDPTRKAVYKVSIVNWDGCAVAAAALLPYAFTKAEQCALLLEFAQSRAHEIANRSSWMPFTTREREIYLELRALNQRGRVI